MRRPWIIAFVAAFAAAVGGSFLLRNDEPAAPEAAPVSAAPTPAPGDAKPAAAAGYGKRPSREGLEPRAEFEAVATWLENSDSRYYGLGKWGPKIEAARSGNLPEDRRFEMLRAVGIWMIAWGSLDEAKSILHEAEKSADNEQRKMKIQQALAQVYLRESEVKNCIETHNRECCIFPIEGGGVHLQDAPARNALARYIELGLAEPDNLSYVWLCNVLAMAAKEYPDGLPESLRIPPAAFESEYVLPRFPDVSGDLGLDMFTLAGGAILEDFDGDGLLDLGCSTIDPRGPFALFINDAKGGFVDRTKGSNLENQLGGLDCLQADYDDDGDADILIPRGAWLFEYGRIRISLMRNDGGNKFTDVTETAGLVEPIFPSQTGAFGDLDADGDLDLYVGSESVGQEGTNEIPTQSRLYLSDGDGTFTLTTEATNERFAKGVAMGDADDDGDIDIYVSNRKGDNRLYENDGKAHFTDVAPQKGLMAPFMGFSTWFYDWNNDGHLDIYAAAYDATIADLAAHYLGRPDEATRPSLYENKGNGTFEDVAMKVGLDRPILPMGASFGDVDGDGWLDMYFATGGPAFEQLMPNVLLRNDEGRRFQDATTSAGMGHLQKGHGVAVGDVDDDGDTDVFTDLGGFFQNDKFKSALFENPGHGKRYLYVELEGRDSNRSGYGARVKVVVTTPAGKREIHRAVGAQPSFGTTPMRQEIGLGDATAIEALEVVWPTTGVHQHFENVPLDRLVRVTEGKDELAVRQLVPRQLRRSAN